MSRKDADDKIFAYLNTRLTNRNTVAWTITMITSSASLILLVLTLEQNNCIIVQECSYFKDGVISPLIFLLGVFFPAIGFAYYVITEKTIHNHDHSTIKKIIKKHCYESYYKEMVSYDQHRKKRELLKYSLFVLPIFGWILLLGITILSIVLSILLVALILGLVCSSKQCKNVSS